MPFTIDLGGRTALVTGAGQGIGRAIALALATAGATVVVNDFVAERAEHVAGEIQVAGGKATAVTFDVTDFDAVVAGVAHAGEVDILVNNAGNAGVAGFNFGPFVESAPDDWQRYFAVNLFGVMHCTRAVLPGMIQREDGRIITIVSDAGRWGDVRAAPYAAAKAGAAGFMRSIAREHGRYGITANSVALGSIDATGLVERATPEQQARFEKQLRSYILRRFGTPDEVAAIVTFLAGPQAAWITGQTYPMNGGYTVNQ